MNEATHALIIDEVQRVLQSMGFSGSVTCSETLITEDRHQALITITTDDSRLLIGNGGACLAAFEHIVRCLLRHKLAELDRITVDINGYRQERERGLSRLAEDSAHKAIRTGRTVALRPMSSPDRRAIHTALSNRADITTESCGEGAGRRVLIKPVFLP